MKKLQWLDDGIKKIIDTFQYEMYAVHVDESIDCACKNFTTKQGDPKHKLCLGTGQKIKIKKIQGASQESSSSFRNTDTSEAGTAMIYYIDSKYHIKENDIIVDNGDIFVAHRIERKKGTNRDYVYQKCICINKKTDVQVFLKNFNEIVKR